MNNKCIVSAVEKRPSIRQMVRAFQAELEAKYPGAEQAGHVVIAANAYLLVMRNLRRRIRQRRETRNETAHSLQASRALSEALAALRGPEAPKAAPLSPRQQFEATLAELDNRDRSTAAPPSPVESGAQIATSKSSPPAADGSPEGKS